MKLVKAWSSEQEHWYLQYFGNTESNSYCSVNIANVMIPFAFWILYLKIIPTKMYIFWFNSKKGRSFDKKKKFKNVQKKVLRHFFSVDDKHVLSVDRVKESHCPWNVLYRRQNSVPKIKSTEKSTRKNKLIRNSRIRYLYMILFVFLIHRC